MSVILPQEMLFFCTFCRTKAAARFKSVSQSIKLFAKCGAIIIKIFNGQSDIIKNIDVVGVKIGDAPGKLSKALDVLDKANINMEYLYAFLTRTEKHAYVVIRVADNAAAEKALTDNGFHIITDADIAKL